MHSDDPSAKNRNTASSAAATQIPGRVSQVEYMESVLTTLAIAIITINEQGTVEFFNKSAQALFGYEPDEVLGKNIKMLMPPPYHDEHDGYLANYMQTGTAKILNKWREVVGRHKDGTTFPIEIAVREFTIDGKRKFTGAVRDLSDLKKAHAELERQSHDIRELSTPVISVWDDVLVLPLIGNLDSWRTQLYTEKALTRMAEKKARVLILDITGVAVVDTRVANDLVRLGSSIRLMGGRCILTGISPNIAITIIGLGIDLSMLNTRATLAEGLKLAIEWTTDSRPGGS